MNELEILYKAVHSKFGVRVGCSQPELLMQRLYALRKKEGLEQIVIKKSPVNPEGELYLLNRSLPDAEEA